MTCTSILAPAYALSHESFFRSEIQKPLLQACYGRSWCWSLAQSRSWSLHGSLPCLALRCDCGCRQRQLWAPPPPWPALAWCSCQPPFWYPQLHQHWPGSLSNQSLEEGRARIEALVGKVSKLESANLVLTHKITDLIQQMEDKNLAHIAQVNWQRNLNL